MEQNLFRYIQHSLQKYKVDKQHCKATISQHQITNFLFCKAYQVRKFLCEMFILKLIFIREWFFSLFIYLLQVLVHPLTLPAPL